MPILNEITKPSKPVKPNKLKPRVIAKRLAIAPKREKIITTILDHFCSFHKPIPIKKLNTADRSKIINLDIFVSTPAKSIAMIPRMDGIIVILNIEPTILTKIIGKSKGVNPGAVLVISSIRITTLNKLRRIPIKHKTEINLTPGGTFSYSF